MARLLVLLFVALFSSSAAAPAQAGPAPEVVRLDGAWKLRTGDSLAWAHPALDDGAWATVQVPGEWELALGEYDGFGWYRHVLELPAGAAAAPLGLELNTVGDAFEVFWNGRLIGKRGQFPPAFVEGLDPSLFLVPEEALRAAVDGRHVVAVRVYNDYAYGGMLGTPVLGSYERLASHRSPRDVVIGGLVSFFLAIGIYHLAFFFRRRSAPENLYFTALCALVSLYGATYSDVFCNVVIPWVNPYRLGLIALLLSAPWFMALTYRLFELPFGRREWVVTGVVGALTAVAVVLPLGVLAEVNEYIDGGLVVGLMFVIARAARAASPRRPNARLLLAGTAVFGGTIIYDLLSEYGWVPLAWVLPGVGGLFWVGFLVFILAVGIATAGKWALTEVTALVDPLTELSRRHVFDEALRRETERLRRSGGPVAVALIDLDHFKRINDTHGHRVGDEVLARVGRLLRHTARNVDVTARLGGEEFAVLLPETGMEGALAFSERFRTHLRGLEFRVPGGVARVTASVGVAVGEDLVDPEELLAAADRVLYRAKHTGRDRMVGVSLRTQQEVEQSPPPREGVEGD